jgi:hypothetical protein
VLDHLEPMTIEEIPHDNLTEVVSTTQTKRNPYRMTIRPGMKKTSPSVPPVFFVPDFSTNPLGPTFSIERTVEGEVTTNSAVQVASPSPVKSTEQDVTKSPPVDGWLNRLINVFQSAPQITLHDTKSVIIWIEEEGAWADTTSEVDYHSRAITSPCFKKNASPTEKNDLMERGQLNFQAAWIQNEFC